jgi:glutamyl-tRNA reductase
LWINIKKKKRKPTILLLFFLKFSFLISIYFLIGGLLIEQKMSKKILIYGAYGYTGRLIVPQAIKNGLKENIIIGGRNEEKVKLFAKKYEITETKVFSVDDKNLEKYLDDTFILLNCADHLFIPVKSL